MTTTAVVLAAGTSSRMGQHKMLLALNGETVIQRAVRGLLETGFVSVTVVVGHEADAIKTNLADYPCRFAYNPEFATSGMEASLRTAVLSLPETSSAMLFALADQVFVTPPMYTALQAARGDAPIAASRFGEIIAPPHLFSRELFNVLGTPGNGAKPLIQKHRERVVLVDQPEAALFDLDTPEDLERARQTLLMP